MASCHLIRALGFPLDVKEGMSACCWPHIRHKLSGCDWRMFCSGVRHRCIVLHRSPFSVLLYLTFEVTRVHGEPGVSFLPWALLPIFRICIVLKHSFSPCFNFTSMRKLFFCITALTTMTTARLDVNEYEKTQAANASARLQTCGLA